MKQGDTNGMGQPDGHTPQKRYNNAEAKDILGLCERSIFDARMSGLLPSSQNGKRGRVSFVWEDFETYWKNMRK